MNTDKRLSAEELLQRLRVLYVEDDADTRTEMMRFLKRRVSYLAGASNGKDALTACETCAFDVIITDLKMPEMDGITFVRTLRSRGYKCPVIITSAFSDSETILQAVDLGIVKYCIKPLNTAELTVTLEKLACDAFVCAASTNFISSDRQERLDFEKALKGELAHFIKNQTGKGPKDVQILMGKGLLDISIIGALTPLESTLMDNPANAGLIAYLRRTFYVEMREPIQKIIVGITGAPVRLQDIDIDPLHRIDRLSLKF